MPLRCRGPSRLAGCLERGFRPGGAFKLHVVLVNLTPCWRGLCVGAERRAYAPHRPPRACDCTSRRPGLRAWRRSKLPDRLPDAHCRLLQRSRHRACRAQSSVREQGPSLHWRAARLPDANARRRCVGGASTGRLRWRHRVHRACWVDATDGEQPRRGGAGGARPRAVGRRDAAGRRPVALRGLRGDRAGRSLQLDGGPRTAGPHPARALGPEPASHPTHGRCTRGARGCTSRTTRRATPT